MKNYMNDVLNLRAVMEHLPLARAELDKAIKKLMIEMLNDAASMMKYRVVKHFQAWCCNPPKTRWVEVGMIIGVHTEDAPNGNGHFIIISEADVTWETAKQDLLDSIEPLQP